MSGRSETKQLILYKYEQSRAHKHAVNYLKEYSGILLSDGYQAYEKVDNAIQARCWSYLRRKLNEALELVPKCRKKEETQAYKCFTMINKLFKIEKDNSNVSYDQLKEIRQEKSSPVVDEFFENIHELE